MSLGYPAAGPPPDTGFSSKGPRGSAPTSILALAISRLPSSRGAPACWVAGRAGQTVTRPALFPDERSSPSELSPTARQTCRPAAAGAGEPRDIGGSAAVDLRDERGLSLGQRPLAFTRGENVGGRKRRRPAEAAIEMDAIDFEAKHAEIGEAGIKTQPSGCV